MYLSFSNYGKAGRTTVIPKNTNKVQNQQVAKSLYALIFLIPILLIKNFTPWYLNPDSTYSSITSTNHLCLSINKVYDV